MIMFSGRTSEKDGPFSLATLMKEKTDREEAEKSAMKYFSQATDLDL